jgi:4-amino-4-deoxy-L-arabinose transferase-like glycosyltransferase
MRALTPEPPAGCASLVKTRGDVRAYAALLLLGSLAFVHLMALPVFADEGGQLRWMWRIVEAGDWLQPLGDGKPMEAWPMVPLIRLGLDPITAARAMHVLAGMLGAVLVYRLALRLGDRRAAIVSGALFAICPFVVYLQRLALSDMFLCTAGIWVTMSVMKFVEAASWRHAIELGLSLVLAALCKLPVGFVFLGSLPLALPLMPAPARRALLRPPALRRALAAHAPAILLALAVLLVAMLRLRRGQSPGFGLQDLAGVGLGRYPDIAASLGVARPRLLDELAAQLSWPVTVAGLVGVVASALRNDWRQRWLIAVGALPMLAIGLLAEFWFSRYLLFTLPPLIVASACGWQSLALRARGLRVPVELGVLAVCAGFMGRQSALLILDPGAANWSRVDRVQYFEAPGSGFGFPEAAKFLLAAPAAASMIYSLDGYTAEQLLSYLPASWRTRVKPVSYGADGAALHTDADRLRNLLSRSPVWIIVPEQLLQVDLQANFGRLDPEQVSLRQIAAFDKPGLRARLAIYQVAQR